METQLMTRRQLTRQALIPELLPTKTPLTYEQLQARYQNLQRKRHNQRTALKRLHKAYAYNQYQMERKDERIAKLEQALVGKITIERVLG